MNRVLLLILLLLPVCLLILFFLVLVLVGKHILKQHGHDLEGKSFIEILREMPGKLKSTRKVEGEPILVTVADYPGSPWYVPTAVLSFAVIVGVPLLLALFRVGGRDVATMAASLASMVGAAVQLGSSQLRKQTVRLVITDRGVHIKRRFKKKWEHAFKARWNHIDFCESRRKGVRFVLKPPTRKRSIFFRADEQSRQLIRPLVERFECAWKEVVDKRDLDSIA